MDNNLLTVEETATLLKVHKDTVYGWLADGKLPGTKIGDLWRISRENINRLFDNSVKKIKDSSENKTKIEQAREEYEVANNVYKKAKEAHAQELPNFNDYLRAVKARDEAKVIRDLAWKTLCELNDQKNEEESPGG